MLKAIQRKDEVTLEKTWYPSSETLDTVYMLFCVREDFLYGLGWIIEHSGHTGEKNMPFHLSCSMGRLEMVEYLKYKGCLNEYGTEYVPEINVEDIKKQEKVYAEVYAKSSVYKGVN